MDTTELEVARFCKVEGALSESPLWHPRRKSLFWLDILEKRLFEKRFNSPGDDCTRTWEVPEFTSSIALCGSDNGCLWMVTARSFGRFELTTGRYDVFVSLPIGAKFRTNDGGVSPSGDYWFGTMAWDMADGPGRICTVSPDGKFQERFDGIGIPNTFCWSQDGNRFYLSDSLKGKIFTHQYRHGLVDNKPAEILVDLGDVGGEPDGGAIDFHDNLWVAIWGKSEVRAYSCEGALVYRVKLPVPNVSSCCFGGINLDWLFVTSARVGLESNELESYPDSGSVFLLKSPVKGIPKRAFSSR